jgi:purine-binding chemotaxis protein CheW
MKRKKDKEKKPIDWNEVRLRLEKSQEALDKGWSVDDAERRRILKERAKALAAQPEKTEQREQIQVVEFLLSHERYALESGYIREVYPLKEYTPVPCTPSFVLGIINVRGEILSILDIRKIFGLPELGLGDLNRVIVLNSGNMEFGVLADSIMGISNISTKELVGPPPTFTGLRREFLKGLIPGGAALLDAARILSDPKIVVNEFV